MSVRAAPSRSRPFSAAIQGLASRADPACLVDCDGTVLFVNEAWDRFALENGGGPACRGPALVGTRLQDHVSGEEPQQALRALVKQVLRQPAGAGAPRVLQTTESNGPEVARLVSTQLEPVVSGTEVLGLVLVHRVVRELPVGEVYPVREGGRDYRGPDGAVEQCSCCRRTRRPEEPEEWDFVPPLVAVPPGGTRFSYCALCRELHHAGVPGDAP